MEGELGREFGPAKTLPEFCGNVETGSVWVRWTIVLREASSAGETTSSQTGKAPTPTSTTRLGNEEVKAAPKIQPLRRICQDAHDICNEGRQAGRQEGAEERQAK